ncbi:MAG TPA: hypothetical protein VFI50_10675, partial [Casimicrobiaceae bacterium]|nr:hypothetical protein [Casimicrobiaceae bacterium]
MNAVTARHRVFVQRAPGRGGLARGDVVDDRAMLAHRYGQDAGLAECGTPMQMQFVDEAAIEDRKLRIASEFDDAVVERDVGAVIAIHITAADRLFHAVDERAEFGGLRGRGVLRRAPPGELVEDGAQFEDGVGFG